MWQRLLDEGTPPQTARDLALAELLENADPPEDRLETTPESD